MHRRLLIAAVLIAVASPSPASELKLERVAMLMRHGIRPPTKAQPIPAQFAPRPWLQWSVGPGLLTPHGAKGAALLAAADRGHARVIRTWEDAPFYARSTIKGRLFGEQVLGVQESLDMDRFRSPIVQFMLPYRMPRASA